MGDLILAGVLAWLVVFVWWGTELVLRRSRPRPLVGACLIAVSVAPTLLALWLGT